jgi:hypothetical protein
MGKLLNEQVVSSDTAYIEFVHGTGGVDFSSTYNGYVVVLHNIRSTTANTMYIQLGTPTIDTSNRGIKWRIYGTGSSYANDSGSLTGGIFETISYTPHTSSAFSAEAIIHFSNISEAQAAQCYGFYSFPDTSYIQLGIGAGVTQATTGNYTKIQVHTAASYWTAGTFQLWGKK